MQRFKNILAVVDTSLDAYPALEWAASLAERNKSKLKIVDGVPDFPWFVRLGLPDHSSIRETLIRDKGEHVEALARPIREKGVDVETRVLMGETSSGIIGEVRRGKHDLVVRVTKGVHSRRPGFIGTTSMQLLRKCPCPVWLVKPEGTPSFTRVLAAVDITPEDEAHAELNKSIMELATSIAYYQRGHCHVVHVWEIFGCNLLRSHMREEDYRDLVETTEAKMAEGFREFLAPYRENIPEENAHLLEGDPGRMIPLLSADQKVDLIVMGTIARVGIYGLLLGNTAELVLDHVECPVLAIKPEGFEKQGKSSGVPEDG